MSVGVRGGGGRGYLCCFLKFSAHAQLKNSNINNNYNNNCNLSMSLQQKNNYELPFQKIVLSFKRCTLLDHIFKFNI